MVSALVWALDIAYKTTNDISYVSREKCVLYKNLPRPGFLLLEYFLETLIIVFVCTFLAVLVSRHFLRLRRFLPSNPITAFLYGSLIPVCSCAAIPMLYLVKGKLKFPTMMSFVLAAPLLSPYIVFLSFSVLGPTYGALRIAASFVLVTTTSFVLGWLQRDTDLLSASYVGTACSMGCGSDEPDIYLATYDVFRRLIPYLVLSGIIGVALEHQGLRRLLYSGKTGEGLASLCVFIVVGIPLYFCNGAEVLFLRPLMNHGLPMGTGIAFSMTSTVICVTSIGMLLKIIGTRLTVVLIACVGVISLAIGLGLNWVL